MLSARVFRGGLDALGLRSTSRPWQDHQQRGEGARDEGFVEREERVGFHRAQPQVGAPHLAAFFAASFSSMAREVLLMESPPSAVHRSSLGI